MDTNRLLQSQVATVLIVYIVYGVIYIDAYYAGFGVSYQFIDLNYNHILYRAFTISYANLAFFVLTLTIVLAFVLQLLAVTVPIGKYRINAQHVSYALLLACLLAGSYMARTTGYAAAAQDAYLQDTALRQLVRFQSPDAAKNSLVNKLLSDERPVLILLGHQQELVLFKPPLFVASRPKFPVYRIKLSSNDAYVSRFPDRPKKK